jgi:polysaccharide biosynthesis protein PslF
MMSSDSQRLAVAILGAFSPDRNGVAIHNLGLANGLGLTGGAEVSVVRTGRDNPVIKDSRVVSQLRPRWQGSATEALRALNAHDLVLIQQDFCSFGCDDGREVLEVLDGVEAPVITTVHHVPGNPSISQLHVLEGVIQRSDCVVVFSQVAAARLARYFPPEAHGDETFDGSQATVFIIPRGAIGTHTVGSRRVNGEYDSTRILTPGFLRPGKGIEWAIEAFAAMNQLIPALRYVVAGPDLHPDTAAYRRMLMQLAAARGLGGQVIFDDRFLSPRAMADLISTSAAVVLPYDDLGRESSSVLIDVLSSGTPVISSKFEFATELLSGGGGVLVDYDDPAAVAAAIESVVIRPHLRSHQGERALAISQGFAWRSIAQSYLRLGTSVIAAHRSSLTLSPNGNRPQGVLTAV